MRLQPQLTAYSCDVFRYAFPVAICWLLATWPPSARCDGPNQVIVRTLESSDATNDGLLTASGVVLLPDGLPAADVVVTALGNNYEHAESTRTDAQGLFHLRHLFASKCAIHAHTADWRLQATWMTSPHEARKVLQKPVELKLSPARERTVTTKSNGKPAEGTRIVATGIDFAVSAISDKEGLASLWLPKDTEWNEGLVAWHPQQGIDGKHFGNTGGYDSPNSPLELSLLPSKPQKIRIVDQYAEPAGDIRFSLAVNTPNSWAAIYEIPEADLQTDKRGETNVPWMPAIMKHINVQRLGGRPWKADEIDYSLSEFDHLTTILIRKRQPVTGRLFMPNGENPEGILVKGYGFGLGSDGDLPMTRVRKDGTFTFLAASDHGYALGISDTEWASDIWAGAILLTEDSKPAEVALKAYPAISVTIRAARGPQSEPWPGVWINGSSRHHFGWTDSRGETHSCSAGVETFVQTDANGIARIGVGRCELEFSLSSGQWSERREVKVESKEPISLEVHGP